MGPDADDFGGRNRLSLRLAKAASAIRADLSLAFLDVLVTIGAYAAALLLRFEGTPPSYQWSRFWQFIAVAVVVHLACNRAWGLYGQLWHHASIQEARRVVLAGASSLVLLLAIPFPTARLPFSVRVVGMGVVVAGMGAVRFQSRLFAFQRGEGGETEKAANRVVVIGAGEAGAAILRDMMRHADVIKAVAIVDDDPRKRGRRLLGVPVCGRIEELPAVAFRFDATEALLAIPSADQDLNKKAANAAEAADIPMRVLPGLAELVHGVSLRDVRDLRIDDLIGRQQVETDRRAISDVLQGRRVLITGAGGSIGSEISRQVAACHPSTLILLDHDETHLHDVAAQLPRATEVLADIRDERAIEEVFARFEPEIVFHAAAHKHVPMLEAHPCEAITTNVEGTENVLKAARGRASHLVFISTDKAVEPTSVMGASKRLGEQLVLSSALPGDKWCAVRFGNVLGSRGSVIPTFIRQIRAGGPVTVTDERMTRFFMSTEEAVQLVLQAAAMAKGGEVFMLDMGEPVNIRELAARMIRLSGNHVGTDIAIEYTGMRPGEKLEEQLRAPEETPWPTEHSAISSLQPVPPDQDLDRLVEALADAARDRRPAEVRRLLLPLEEDVTEPATSAPDEAWRTVPLGVTT